MRAVLALIFIVGVATARQIYNGQVYEDYKPAGSTVPQIVDLQKTVDEYGQYSLLYKTEDGTVVSEQGYLKPKEDGSGYVFVKKGFFEFYTPDGKSKKITYTADETGFHPEGEHIPK